jgi:hypothetical protein
MLVAGRYTDRLRNAGRRQMEAVPEAERLLEEEGVKADFGGFEDVYLQDADVDLLYNLAFDGIEDSETGDELGLDHLRFENWFKPFLNATPAVHPYSARQHRTT